MRWLPNATFPAALLLGAVAVRPAAAAVEIYEAPTPAPAIVYQESPLLEPGVSAGTLPPIGQRLPVRPGVMLLNDDRVNGQPGGQLRMLIGSAKDIRALRRRFA